MLDQLHELQVLAHRAGEAAVATVVAPLLERLLPLLFHALGSLLGTLVRLLLS
jgi:hypothetical protein